MNPSSLLSLDPALLILTVLLMVLLFAMFLLFGATAAGVNDITITKVFITAVSVIAVQWIVAVLFSAIPVIGGILGFILSICAMVYVLRVNFNSTWIIAGKVWVLAVIAEVATGLVLELYFGINVWDFIHQIFFVS